MMFMEPPATNLRDAYNAVLLEPLQSGDPRWVDCTSASGDTDVVGQRVSELRDRADQQSN